MDSGPAGSEFMETAGVTVRVDRGLHVAAIRYVDPSAIKDVVTAVLGVEIPAPLRAVWPPPAGGAGVGECLVLWRNPHESWLISSDAAPSSAIAAALREATMACIVDQTGGIRPIRIRGRRRGDLLIRLASVASIPATNQALAGRWADVTAVAVGSSDDETILLVERVYADHILGWIRETLADL